MTGRWVEVADGVLARRYVELDQTLGLVVGSERCLVVDTGTDEVHGAEFAAAVREVTPLPWTVVVTHAHFDHFCGTAAFLPCPVWAHERCRAAMADSAAHREEWVRRYESRNEPERARRLAESRVVVPTETVTGQATLDLGGRQVALIHPGRAHTDHDVLVHVPDAKVVLAGDLVEEGAPPSVGPDAYAREWPAALDRLLALNPSTIVPGHGDPVTPAYTRTQRDTIR